jgi:hypothetical protein
MSECPYCKGVKVVKVDTLYCTTQGWSLNTTYHSLYQCTDCKMCFVDEKENHYVPSPRFV